MSLQTTADLIADVLFRAGEPTDATSQYAATALAYLNRAYLGLAAGGGELVPEMREEWRWLKNTAPGVINLLPAIAPGLEAAPLTVNATFNSPAISFAGIFADLLGWEIKIGDNPDIFRLVAHTPHTGLATLDAAWNGPSGTYGYVLAKLEYALAADVLRLVSPLRCFRPNGACLVIHEVDREHLYGYHPLACAEAGMPSHYTRITEQLIRFDRYAPQPLQGVAMYRVEYDYIRRPALLTAPGTTEEPLVPWEWRRVLADWALYWLLVDKSDTRADAVGLSAKNGLLGCAHENQYAQRAFDRTPAFGSIAPRSACGRRY